MFETETATPGNFPPLEGQKPMEEAAPAGAK
jgi:hypothetical protein